jgi:hypothetical protein
MFKSSFGRGLVAAMESADDSTLVDEVIPAADSAETSLLETAEAGAEVTGTLDDIASAQADGDSLGAIAETMEATEETGGLDPVAAEVAEVAVESICNRLGVTRRKYALESFSSKDKRVAATRYAVEEIKDVLKRIWDAIVAAFGKVKEFLKNFFKALFDSNEKLAQRADALVNKATNAKGAPKEKEIAAGGFGKALATGGTFKKAAVIEALAGMPAWLTSTMASTTQKPSFADKLKDMIADQKVFDGYQLPAFKESGYKASGSEGGMATFTGQELVGGRAFRVQRNDKALKGAEAFAAIGNWKIELATLKDAKAFEGDKVEALSADEIVKVATAARELSRGVIAVRKTQDALDKEIGALQGDARTAASAAPKEDEASARERAQLLARALSAAIQYNIRELTTATKYSTDVVKSGLDYAERALSNIKEEEAAK